MHTTSTSTHALRAIGVITAIAVPMIVLAATNTDAQFRDCMRNVSQNWQNRLVDVVNLLNDRKRQTALDRRANYMSTWNIENDRDRSNAQKAIETDVRNRDRDADKLYRDDVRNAQNDFRNGEKDCRNAFTQREKDRRSVPVGRQCYNSDDCFPSTGICTTDFGDCRSACQRGSNPCIQVCTGVCVIR